MGTRIVSNGSKWAGEAPDTIETLIEVLKAHMLDPGFSEYANFIRTTGKGEVHFFGDFRRLSHVFNIHTDEPKVIARLTRAIRENMRREDYIFARKSFEQIRQSKGDIAPCK
jgi:hypothetical protein